MIKADITKMDLIDFRPGEKRDTAFILATWLRGLRFGNSWYNLIDYTIYFRVYHEILEKLLVTSTTTIKIACLKDDPEVILGFSVYSGERLHWVHVKKAWRKIGIGKSLVPKNTVFVSHLTEVGKSLMLKKKLKFNPFFII